MKLIIGSDHAGYNLKQEVIEHARQQGHDIIDMGCFSPDPVDYPDIARDVVLALQNDPMAIGCLMCGTGIGMGIAANRYPGIRAAVVNDSTQGAYLGRAHNNANILCMGSWLIKPELAKKCLDTFLNTDFEGGRHQARLDKIR
jgi:ribose 5-phosphate isomerase B